MALLIVAVGFTLGSAQGAAAFGTDNCVIMPEADTQVAPQEPGLLARVFVSPSQEVTSGQLLAELASGAQRASLDIAKQFAGDESAVEIARTRLAYEEKLLETSQQLAARNALSQQALEEQASNVALRRAELAQALSALERARFEVAREEAALERRRIRSPIDGIVLEQFLEPGEFSREDAAIFRVGKLDLLRVEAILPQDLHDKVALGDQVEVLPELPGLQPTQGEVTQIDAVIDPSSATFVVVVAVPNAELRIVAGINCIANFPD